MGLQNFTLAVVEAIGYFNFSTGLKIITTWWEKKCLFS